MGSAHSPQAHVLFYSANTAPNTAHTQFETNLTYVQRAARTSQPDPTYPNGGHP